MISGAVSKSMSATHMGSSFSFTSHFSEPVFLLSMMVSKSRAMCTLLCLPVLFPDMQLCLPSLTGDELDVCP